MSSAVKSVVYPSSNWIPQRCVNGSEPSENQIRKSSKVQTNFEIWTYDTTSQEEVLQRSVKRNLHTADRGHQHGRQRRPHAASCAHGRLARVQARQRHDRQHRERCQGRRCRDQGVLEDRRQLGQEGQEHNHSQYHSKHASRTTSTEGGLPLRTDPIQ